MDLASTSPQPAATPQTPRTASKHWDRRCRIAIDVFDRSCLERNDLGYYSSVFAITNLPHRDLGPKGTCWTRRNGHASLVVRPGLIPGPDGSLISAGIPYGMWPRLLVLYLATEAVRTRSPQIELGRSLADFFRRLKLIPDTRRVQMLRRQALRLFSASIQFTFSDSEILGGSSAQLAEQYLLWRSENDIGDSRPRNASHVTLTTHFFRGLLAHPYPVDIGAIHGLRQSPLALDLFLWLPLRLRALRHPLNLRYDTLAEQMGSNYARKAEFARHCLRALQKIQQFWFGLRYRRIHDGIQFLPCELPVPIRTNPTKQKIQ
ncbi:MAG: Plasmid encoded RepA protein [Verrucomicrobia bacterium ADurb.Bin122]|nr:MAG: Plasmid encoded RepA protein [Verrucomicrobia bacterium ADurb.Bin122]